MSGTAAARTGAADSSPGRSAAGGTEPWFPYAGTGPGVPVYCVPHAGGSASAYRGWVARAAPGLCVVPVQPPGRESRFGEEPLRRVADLAERIAEAMRRRPGFGEGPYALFGHSMGALVVFELAHLLSGLGCPPSHLFVSANPRPDLPRTIADVHAASTEAVKARLELLGGTQSEVLTHSPLFDALLPLIRADFEVCETYRPAERGPLAVPITAFGGRDDPRVAPEQVRGWRALTTGAFAARIFPGGHFYLTDPDNAAGLLASIRAVFEY